MIDIFPARALTLPVSVTSSASTSVALPALGGTLRIVNEGPNIAFISVGTGTQPATLPNATPTGTSTPVLPGCDIILSIPNQAATPLNISAICRESGTATLDVQVGEGL